MLAEEETRPAIWEAILARRTYAVTCDKMACRFQVDGAHMDGGVHSTAHE